MSFSDRIVLRRSTVLADARGRGGSLSRDSIVRVGDFGANYEWPGLRGPVAPARRRQSDSSSARSARTNVGTVVDYQPWLVVSTAWSREKPETKTAIPVGSVVRFTVQRGLKAAGDASEMVILRGKVVATRSALLPDSYAVQETEVVLTHDLDSSVETPAIGQVFLVAPESVGSIESIGSEAPPTLVIPATSEFDDKSSQPTASTPPAGWTIPSLGDATGALGLLSGALGGALGGGTGTAPAAGTTTTTTTTTSEKTKTTEPVVTPSTAPGTPDSLATEPAGLSGTSIAIAIGVLLVGAIGFAAWRLA
jgi:hypothetical protein